MCLKLKILLASLIICVLTSCGGDKTIIDPEFKVFVSDFEQKIGVKVQNIIIKFSPTKYPIIGMCITGGETNEIHIDPQNWMGINKDGQELILYHELGHCILGLPHDDRRSTLDNVSVEGSIMNTYFFGNRSYYSKYKENYKRALRNNTVVSQEIPMSIWDQALSLLKFLKF